MQYTKKAREEYNKTRSLSCAKLGITEHQYNWFRRNGEKLRKIYEDACNGIVSYENMEYINLVDPIYELVDSKAESLGLSIYYQTDPRGATIYLSANPVDSSNYSSKAVCIY